MYGGAQSSLPVSACYASGYALRSISSCQGTDMEPTWTSSFRMKKTETLESLALTAMEEELQTNQQGVWELARSLRARKKPRNQNLKSQDAADANARDGKKPLGLTGTDEENMESEASRRRLPESAHAQIAVEREAHRKNSTTPSPGQETGKRGGRALRHSRAIISKSLSNQNPALP